MRQQTNKNLRKNKMRLHQNKLLVLQNLNLLQFNKVFLEHLYKKTLGGFIKIFVANKTIFIN